MRPTVWAFFRDTQKAATADLRNFVQVECKKDGFDFVLSFDREPWVCLYPDADTSIRMERVARLPLPERTLLAAACAERLMPVYGWIARAEADSVRSALDLAWSASASAEQAEQAQREVEELVPEFNFDAPGFFIVCTVVNFASTSLTRISTKF